MSHLARVRPFLRRVTAASRQFTTRPPWVPPYPMAPPKAWIPNGAMKRGPRFYMDNWGTENGAYLWVLMPGVPKENVSVNVVGNEINFKGTEVVDVPGFPGSEDDIVREYKGCFIVDPGRVDADKLKAEIVDGIFWLHVLNKYPLTSSSFLNYSVSIHQL